MGGFMVSEIALDRIAHALYMRLSDDLMKEFANKPTVNLFVDPLSEAEYFVLQLVTRQYGRMLAEKYVRYPATWWGAFKEQVMPYWIRRRTKINYITKKIEARELYPSIPLKDRRVYYEVKKV